MSPRLGARCGTSVVDAAPGAQVVATDTLVVQALAVSESTIETGWMDALGAGVLELPGRVKRSRTMDKSTTYLIEVRRGNEYRAAEIEQLEQPEAKADSQVKDVYAAVRRLLPR